MTVSIEQEVIDMLSYFLISILMVINMASIAVIHYN